MKSFREKSNTILILSFLFYFSKTAFAEEKISLVDLKPVQTQVGWGEYYTFKDGNCAAYGRPPLICPNGDTSTQTGIWAHAPSEIIFEIPSNSHRFEAVGVTSANLPSIYKTKSGLRVSGSWTYEVLIDGKKAYESEPFMAYETRRIPIQIVIPKDSKVLTLKVNQLGANHNDWSYWGEPYFIRP